MVQDAERKLWIGEACPWPSSASCAPESAIPIGRVPPAHSLVGGAVGTSPHYLRKPNTLQGETARPLGATENVGKKGDGSLQQSCLRTSRTSVPLNLFVCAGVMFPLWMVSV